MHVSDGATPLSGHSLQLRAPQKRLAFRSKGRIGVVVSGAANARMTQPPLSASTDPGLVLVRGPDRPDLWDERKGWIMSVKLTDAQLVMMSAAAQRKDRCLSATATIKGAALGRSASNSRSLVWPARSRRNLERRSGAAMTLGEVTRSN